MSHSTYNKLWSDAQRDLKDLLTQEAPAEPRPPEKDRVVFFQRLVSFYVRYLQIFRQLEEAHDQTVHPQKRRVIRPVLEGVMGRLVELKMEMVETDFSEYHYMDDVVQDMKLTPADLEIPIPRYFLSERSKALQERSAMFTYKLKVNKTGREPVLFPHLNVEQALNIIQVTERARQRLLRATIMRAMTRENQRQRRAADRGPVGVETAAVCIQKMWRGYVQRRRTKKAREEELIFLGMAMDPKYQQPTPSETAAQANKALRRRTQMEHEEDYQKEMVTVTNTLRDVEGPDMKEAMKDQIRQWFIECRDATGSFPEYPDDEDGGSAFIFAEKTPQQLLDEIAAKEEEEEEEIRKTKGKDPSKEKKDVKKKDKGTSGEEEEEAGLKFQPSAFLPDLQMGDKTFTDIWQNRHESENFSQKHDIELIKEEKRKEVEAEIRMQVDELMRQELANLRLAVDKDKGGKAKAKTKKKGSKSGKRKKKDKDLTAGRTLESLCEELVEQGLLKQADDVTMQDYIGDYSYLGTTLRLTDIEPMPSLSDVRQLLSLYAVLPLGSQVTHAKAPPIKAILLAGPVGVGKKMLVHSICQEAGAGLFDLSPVNTAGKYPGKNGLAMMLHLVVKVARLIQPSVVWIGDAEKMFYKKVPKEEKELDPKRLKKDLSKVLKSLKAEDRILVVGTTSDPMSADIKSLCKVYSKILLIPRPDYASRHIMWQRLIQKSGGEVTSSLDLSCLSKNSDGYTPGQMEQVARSILTERRLQRQAIRPLTAVEFVAPLAKLNPVFVDEEEEFKNWYAKTPLGRKRTKAATGGEEEKPPGKGKGKGTNKKGKK